MAGNFLDSFSTSSRELFQPRSDKVKWGIAAKSNCSGLAAVNPLLQHPAILVLYPFIAVQTDKSSDY